MKKYIILLCTAFIFSEAVICAQEPLQLSLAKSIDIAFKNNRRRPASQMSVNIAEAQHAQALSAYWPQVSVKSALSRMDDDPLSIFPEETSTYTIGDVLPTPIQTTVTIPEKRIKLMDKTHFTSALDMTYPLYMGGFRSGITRQSRAGVKAAKQDVRRTDLQLIQDVKRFYYGGLLARDLTRIGRDALSRLEVTLQLTENLYKRGSGTVKKTDFLKHQVVVESVRSIVSQLETNEKLASAALINTLGLDWRTSIVLTDTEIPFEPLDINLETLVAGAYQFNPDWAALHAGLDATHGKIQEAKSGARPTLALLGHMEYIGNSYDAGIVGPEQKKAWRVSLGLELPIFNGFRTRNKVREARARLDKLSHQKVLLRDGLALHIQYLVLQMQGAARQEAATNMALRAASENRSLTNRAYQAGMGEVQDIVETQLMEAFVQAQHHKIIYDHAITHAQLEMVIGNEVQKLIQEALK